MKLGYNRETIIGLSVLLVLTTVLGIVAARRFMHHSERAELAATASEAKIDDHGRDERRREEVRAEKPILDGAVALVSAESENKHDPHAEHEEHAHERHDEAVRAGQNAFVAIATTPELKHEKPEHQDDADAAHKPREHADAAADDRYAVPANDRYAVAPAPLPEQMHGGAAQPTVIQVSGDGAAIAPRHLEGEQRADTRAETRESPVTFRPGREDAMAGRSDAEHFEHRQPPDPAGQYSANPYSAAPSYAGRDSRATYDPVAARPPMENHAQGYPGPSPDYGAAPGYGREAGLRQGEIRQGEMRRDEMRHDEIRREETQGSVTPSPVRSDGQYEVQPNDSYWTISEHIYGSGAYFRALSEANRGKAARPDRLTPGLLISTPPVAQLEKDYPDFCPRANRRETVRNRAAGAASMAAYTAQGHTYTVQEGDTLSSIARQELGKVSRWAEIYQLNRDLLGKDYDYLTPGLRLAMPSRDGPASDRTTRRSDDAPPYVR